MNRKTLAYIIGIILLLMIGGLIAANFLGKERTVQTLSKTAILTLTPATAVVKEGETLTLQINLDSGGQEVDAVDAVLIYDDNVFEVQSLTPTELFPSYPVQTFTGGKITLSAFVLGSGEGPKIEAKKGVLAEVKLKALKKTTIASKIEVSNQSVVAVKGEDILDLSKSKGGECTVQ
ncbi:MAG: hypothetical protein FJ044_01060 [Candidatus Cloacimonetes bacterium]|nr:hypothetical protein [Candidatus Cloacimonadota bacterium]